MFISIQSRLKKARRLLLLVLLPLAAQAQAPANDDCASATPLPVGSTCTVLNGTTTAATASPAAVPAATCATNSATARDVWYALTVPASGAVTVTTSASTNTGTSTRLTDTILQLYSGTCGALIPVGCNDDATGNYSQVVTTGLVAGSTLYARIFGFGSNAGDFGVCATGGVVVPAPVNDNPAGAVALSLLGFCAPTFGTNAGATTTPPVGYTNPQASGCGTAANPRDVWYKFTTAVSGQGSQGVDITVAGSVAGQVRVFASPNGAAGPFTYVACAASASNTVAPVLSMSTLTPATTYYVQVSGYGPNDAQGIFTICATILVLPVSDAAVTTIYSLSKVASAFGSPVSVQAVVSNVGTSTQTNLPVTLTVSGATTFSNTQTVATLAPNASTTVTFTSYPVTATSGTNSVRVSVPADTQPANNSLTVTQAVSANMLSYVAGTTFTGGIGFASSPGNVLATGYQVATTAAVTTVTPTFTGAAGVGATYQVLLYGATAGGLPGTVLFTSAARPRPTAALGTVVTDAVPVANVPVTGQFFVGIKTVGTDNINLAYQVENPLRTGTFFFTTNGTTWTDVSTIPLNARLAVDVAFAASASATRNESLAATVSLCPNPTHQRFTLGVPAGSLHAASTSLLNALGQVVQTRQLNLPLAGGNAEFDVSGLAPGVYSLQLKTANDLVIKRVVVE